MPDTALALEEAVFRRKQVDIPRLLTFGFAPCEGGYRYSRDLAPVMGSFFRAEVLVSLDGRVSGRMWDKDAGEEFLPLRVAAQTGAFACAVRAAYLEVLGEVAANCAIDVPFSHAQANRLAVELARRHGDRPDYPFANYPTYGVFRVPSRKWYALVGSIPRTRLTRKAGRLTADEAADIVEFANLKLAPERVQAMLGEEGIYPCYHMNRGNWVSVLLEDVLPDAQVLALLEESRALVERGTVKAQRRPPRVPTGEMV